MKAVRSVLTFDGKDSHVLLEKKPAHRVARDITLEAWVFVAEHGPEWTGIISKVWDTGDTESGYGLLLDGDGGVYLALKPSTGEAYKYLSSGAGSLPENEWHHIAATYDGKQALLYIDGEKKASHSVEITGIGYNPENDLYIGTNKDDDETITFNGKIGEVSVWSRAKSQDELKKDMAGTVRGDEPGLVAYLPLDEGQGDAGKDGSPTAGHGKIVGAKWEKAEVPFAKETVKPPVKPPTSGGSGGSGGKLAGVIDTSSVLSAALERLNRQSVTQLLQQLVAEMDEHCRTFDGKVADEIAKLRKELTIILDGLRKTTDVHQTEINNLHQMLLALEKLVQKTSTDFYANIGTIVNNKIDVRLPDILKNISINLEATIKQLIDKNTKEIDIDGLWRKIEELSVKLEIIKKSAEELDEGELKQVEELIKKLLVNIDLGDVIQNVKIQVNGSSFSLAELIALLATAHKVQAVHFTYDLTDITGARFVLLDNSEIVFVATRSEDGARSEVEYRFETVNYKGLPASFVLRFRKNTRKMQLCKGSVALDSYDAVYQSNIVFNLAA